MNKIPKKQQKTYKPSILKTVLVALDYDSSAQKVAEAGYSLATSLNAEVILLHVISEVSYYSPLEFSPIMGYSGFNVTDYPNLVDIEIIKAASRQFLEKSSLHLGGERISVMVAEGDTADGILQAAEEKNVDIIVLGTHGRSGLGKMLMGSVAEKVLNRSTRPVFIIPSKKKTRKSKGKNK